MNRNKMASQHDFAMVPRSDIPRSTYMLQQTRKTTFNGSYLVPIYCEEILPGDHFKGSATIFARLATPITPVMDNAELETFFFFVPNRIVWDHWEEFISGGNYTIPIIQSPAGGFTAQTIYDQFGLPCVGQIDPAGSINVSALPFRAYNKIYNEWFRDQNLTTPVPEQTDDGPDPANYYTMLKRAKKHDYFTSCLPWPQKGTAVTLPIASSAPVLPLIPHSSTPTFQIGGAGSAYGLITAGVADYPRFSTDGVTPVTPGAGGGPPNWLTWGSTGLFADLSSATSATINSIRLAFQTQRLLERDARGGTRYVEQILSHFGVRSPDYRLQRPEYIGGGRTMVNTNPIAQTSAVTGQPTPLGNLAAMSVISGNSHKFTYAATEHGYIIGLANVRTDLNYQQGIRRHWQRQTRYDFYFPVFAHLGEQPVYTREIYSTGTNLDQTTFGYQERWAEYRYTPNEICGLFRSTTAGNVDVWHYAEKFASMPLLNDTFITDPSASTLQRSMAVGSGANGQQILFDVLYRVHATRPMPTYSVPGLVDHF